jgi:hypothetical protein
MRHDADFCFFYGDELAFKERVLVVGQLFPPSLPSLGLCRA